jgi:hypothetical protein
MPTLNSVAMFDFKPPIMCTLFCRSVPIHLTLDGVSRADEASQFAVSHGPTLLLWLQMAPSMTVGTVEVEAA